MPSSIRQLVQIQFRNMHPSRSLEDKVRAQVDKLGRYYDSITGCSVVIEICHKHQHKGNLFHIRIDLKIPYAELVVSRDPVENHAHEDVYVAVRDAFASMRRKLQEFVHKKHHMVKLHHKTTYNHVAPEEDIEEYDEYSEGANENEIHVASFVDSEKPKTKLKSVNKSRKPSITPEVRVSSKRQSVRVVK